MCFKGITRRFRMNDEPMGLEEFNRILDKKEPSKEEGLETKNE